MPSLAHVVRLGVATATVASRRTAAAERKRRYRARQDRAAIVCPVEVSPEIIGLLLDLNWLEMSVSEDRAEIGAAIARLLTDAAKAHKS